MRFTRTTVTIVAVALFSGTPLLAQPGIDSTLRRQQRTIDSLLSLIRTVQTRLDSVASAATTTAGRPGAYMNVSFVGLTNVGWSSEGDVASLQVGDHDPHVRGFTVPNAELVLDGAVDPWFKGFLNLVHKLGEDGETGVELEEMYLLTSSLPGNLQVKVGQFFAEFGRQNPLHPHAWGFADQPLVLNRMFGGEGLRGQGARVSWLLPTAFYAEAMLGVFNSAGATTSSFRSQESSSIHGGVPVERGVSGAGDLLYVPRLAGSFDLTANQTLLLGVSGARGPNTAGEMTRTTIIGSDIYWKWKSATANQGFPFVSIQTEFLSREYTTEPRERAGGLSILAGLPIKDDGSYAQLLWGMRPRLVAGIRAEQSNAAAGAFLTPETESRSRWSPSLTWYPSEYSKVRLQYNYDRRAHLGSDHSVWMQFEFLLGAHAAHTF